MTPRDKIYATLRKVYDPEIPLNLVDLGLIYDVRVMETTARVTMTLTAIGCPMANTIAQSVKEAVESVDEISTADVAIVWDPVWNPSMISPDGRAALGME